MAPQARPRGVGLTTTLALLVVMLAGCIEGEPDGDTATLVTTLDTVGFYDFTYGADVTPVPGAPHGWLAQVNNTRTDPVLVDIRMTNNTTEVAFATDEGVMFEAGGASHEVPGNSSVAVLFTGTYRELPLTVAWTVDVYDAATTALLESESFNRTLTAYGGLINPVQPGMHVQTATVGVWVNGTSFYTNIEPLFTDPRFPIYDRDPDTFSGAPLPIYVYADDRSEQPPGSQDNCYFTTITGYNELLKMQAEGSTMIRWLAPEEAYTREGAEDHFLYGDALIFMNTIVVNEGQVGPAGAAPNPAGACFDPANASPIPPPA